MRNWGCIAMKKTELAAAVLACKTETGAALQLLFDNVNPGQQKQLVKRPEIRALFDRYGVAYEA